MDRIEKLNSEQMLIALKKLDEKLTQPMALIIGGGGAMILAHAYPIATTDIDAIPKGDEIERLDPIVKSIADELHYLPDWLNTHYSTYSYTLPSDYGSRLIEVFKGRHVHALALGKNEMLIMKCYAHRSKDMGHAMALVKSGADVDFVEKHIEMLLKKKIPKSQEALDFLYDVLDTLGR